jgi:hypothetical protein
MERKFNLQNTLSRRREFYHGDAADQNGVRAEEGGIQTIHHAHPELTAEAAGALQFDFYRRGSFVDHFCGPDTDLGALKRCDYREYGDFAFSPFRIVEQKGEGVTLDREGFVRGSKVHLRKSFRIDSDLLYVSFQIEHDTPSELLYLCELNLHIANTDTLVVRVDGETVTGLEMTRHLLRTLTIDDPYLDETIQIEWSRECIVFWHPVSTVSQSEQGMELSVQGIMVAFAFAYEPPMELDAAIRWRKGTL